MEPAVVWAATTTVIMAIWNEELNEANKRT
jgi:hypothetical protein